MSYVRLPSPILDQPFARAYTPDVSLRRLGFIVTLALCVLAAPLAAGAQQAARVPRIDVVLTPYSSAADSGQGQEAKGEERSGQ